MEALLLLLDSMAVVLLVFFTVANDSRKDQSQAVGLFRYVESLPPRRRKADATAGRRGGR